jgi:3-phenylpropionate/trans-cinnamate dioxygenase ferredoxin subunit
MFGSKKWIRVAGSVEEIPFNKDGIAEVELGSKTVCVIRNNNLIHACAAKCPHAGAALQFGYVDAMGKLVCPLHRYRFDLKNGRSAEGYYLKIYPVEIREGAVFIEV